MGDVDDEADDATDNEDDESSEVPSPESADTETEDSEDSEPSEPEIESPKTPGSVDEPRSDEVYDSDAEIKLDTEAESGSESGLESGSEFSEVSEPFASPSDVGAENHELTPVTEEILQSIEGYSKLLEYPLDGGIDREDSIYESFRFLNALSRQDLQKVKEIVKKKVNDTKGTITNIPEILEELVTRIDNLHIFYISRAKRNTTSKGFRTSFFSNKQVDDVSLRNKADESTVFHFIIKRQNKQVNPVFVRDQARQALSWDILSKIENFDSPDDVLWAFFGSWGKPQYMKDEDWTNDHVPNIDMERYELNYLPPGNSLVESLSLMLPISELFHKRLEDPHILYTELMSHLFYRQDERSTASLRNYNRSSPFDFSGFGVSGPVKIDNGHAALEAFVKACPQLQKSNTPFNVVVIVFVDNHEKPTIYGEIPENKTAQEIDDTCVFVLWLTNSANWSPLRFGKKTKTEFSQLCLRLNAIWKLEETKPPIIPNQVYLFVVFSFAKSPGVFRLGRIVDSGDTDIANMLLIPDENDHDGEPPLDKIIMYAIPEDLNEFGPSRDFEDQDPLNGQLFRTEYDRRGSYKLFFEKKVKRGKETMMIPLKKANLSSNFMKNYILKYMRYGILHFIARHPNIRTPPVNKPNMIIPDMMYNRAGSINTLAASSKSFKFTGSGFSSDMLDSSDISSVFVD